MKDKIARWVVWRLPKRLVFWCYIRLHAKATCTQYSHLTPDEVTWDMALKAWDSGEAKDG